MDVEILDAVKDNTKALGRIGDLIEKVMEEPKIEIEIPPPVCPHCRKINPTIQLDESIGRGQLGSFVLKCLCMHCGKTMYAVPLVWASFTNTETAISTAAQNLERILGDGRSSNARETKAAKN